MIIIQNKAYKKALSKTQSISIRKLILTNSKIVRLCILRDIFYNSAIALFKLNKTPTFFSNLLINDNLVFNLAFKTPSIDSQVAIKFKSFRKKRLKIKLILNILIKYLKKKLLNYYHFYLL